MSNFIANLFKALGVITVCLEEITFTINQSTLRLLDVVIYSVIISMVLTMIKKISYNGAFSISRNRLQRLDAGAKNIKGD